MPEYTYSVVVTARRLSAIYTRNPITHAISKHERPFTDLPPVSTPLHPVFATYHAYGALGTIFGPKTESELAFRIGKLMLSCISSQFLALCRKTAARPSTPPKSCPSLTDSPSTSSAPSSQPSQSSKKRKYEEDPVVVVVGEWVDGIQKAALDEVPVVDVGPYAKEVVREVSGALRDGPAWHSVSKKKKLRST